MQSDRRTYKNKKSSYSKKKALCIASVASNLDNFNRNNVDILLELGYEITLAANFHTKEDINSQERINAFSEEMKSKGIHIIHVDFTRRIGNLKLQWESVFQVKKLLKNRFDLIHCHSPICAAIVRAEAERYRKKYGTKVVYTAHGFHFFNGAPLKNWIFYYSIEKLMSKFTDVLITINREDYKRGKKYFKSGRVYYIPGVGIPVKEFGRSGIDRLEQRKLYSIPENAFVAVSVGEINYNKNHETIIRAVAHLKNKNIHYIICGIGKQEEYLKLLSRKLGINQYIHFLGYRTDIADILHMCDVFVFPSKREGLGLAALEGMASGLPLITSNVGGIKDYMIQGKTGFINAPDDVDGFANSMNTLFRNPDMRIKMGKFNREYVLKFDIENVASIMKDIYMKL